LRMMGDSIGVHAQGFDTTAYDELLAPDTWSSTVDTLLASNIRFVRFHSQPVPPWVLDIADQRGLLIMDESPIYARSYLQGFDGKAYVANAQTWLAEWVRARRNHPSLIRWSAENEMGLFGLLGTDQLHALGAVIRAVDPTRPVSYDGDVAAAEELLV